MFYITCCPYSYTFISSFVQVSAENLNNSALINVMGHKHWRYSEDTYTCTIISSYCHEYEWPTCFLNQPSIGSMRTSTVPNCLIESLRVPCLWVKTNVMFFSIRNRDSTKPNKLHLDFIMPWCQLYITFLFWGALALKIIQQHHQRGF